MESSQLQTIDSLQSDNTVLTHVLFGSAYWASSNVRRQSFGSLHNSDSYLEPDNSSNNHPLPEKEAILQTAPKTEESYGSLQNHDSDSYEEPVDNREEEEAILRNIPQTEEFGSRSHVNESQIIPKDRCSGTSNHTYYSIPSVSDTSESSETSVKAIYTLYTRLLSIRNNFQNYRLPGLYRWQPLICRRKRDNERSSSVTSKSENKLLLATFSVNIVLFIALSVYIYIHRNVLFTHMKAKNVDTRTDYLQKYVCVSDKQLYLHPYYKMDRQIRPGRQFSKQGIVECFDNTQHLQRMIQILEVCRKYSSQYKTAVKRKSIPRRNINMALISVPFLTGHKGNNKQQKSVLLLRGNMSVHGNSHIVVSKTGFYLVYMYFTYVPANSCSLGTRTMGITLGRFQLKKDIWYKVIHCRHNAKHKKITFSVEFTFSLLKGDTLSPKLTGIHLVLNMNSSNFLGVLQLNNYS